MEIINKKEIKSFVKTILIITSILTILPLIAYFINFSGGISDDQTVWGTFGDYFGGIIGTFFSLIAVIFSFLSIYITLKIATKIYEEEEKLHRENDLREERKFEHEVELIHKQNMPLPSIYEDYSSDTKIKIQLENHGLGSLKINSWSIKYNDKTFLHFESLLSEVINNFSGIRIEWDDSLQHMLAPGKKKTLLKVTPTSDNKQYTNFKKHVTQYKEIFKNSEICFEYEDIFGNKFSFNHKFEA